MMAKDNIDLNAKSTMIKSHFHGTSISVFQYPSENNPGIALEHTFNDDNSSVSKKLAGLPKEYSEVNHLPSYTTDLSIYAPLCTINLPPYLETLPSLEKSTKYEFQWLDCFSTSFTSETCDSWSKHHASFARRKCGISGINAIMPMINKVVHTLETQYHVMNLNKKSTSFLNPGQTPVDTCDQPVYALTKTIQWKFPLDFGILVDFILKSLFL